MADDPRRGEIPRGSAREPAGGSGERPEYKVYRARPRLFRGRDDLTGIGSGGARGDVRSPSDRSGGERPYTVHRSGRERRRIPFSLPGRGWFSLGRLFGWLLAATAAWLLVSLVIFLVSAQIQREQMADEAVAALEPAGFPLTEPNTILILGSDARTKQNAEPGSRVGGPSRADSIMLMRIGGGANSTLSIPRDTVVDIPGHGRDKINAAYALGGPALAIQTVEQFLGIDVNHVVEVNFENFPKLIDSLGGIEVRTGCVVSLINGGRKNGGYTLRLRPGVNHLSGDDALALARTRKNNCAPKEDDRTRARRQQKILAALKDQVVSVETFLRLPFVSWAAPQAVRSDMAGPDLLGVAGATVLGGSDSAKVLKPSGTTTLPDGGAGLTVSDAEKQRAVERLLQG